LGRPLVTVIFVALAASACLGASGSGSDAAAPPAPKLRIPYGIALDQRGRLYVADGGRHQILRWVEQTRRFAVIAGTGSAGTRGDGAPARLARLNEVTSLAFDRSGNLYATDLAENRVRRIDRRGRITTFARLRAPVGIALHPRGGHLEVASLENRIYRIELRTRRVTRIAGDGTAATSGDGGRAGSAQVNGPHGLAYDAGGTLYIAAFPIRAIDPRGVIRTVAPVNAFNLLPAPDGALLAAEGDPDGGAVFRLASDGTRTAVAGTGSLSRHIDGVDARTVGILPSYLAWARDRSLLVAQTKPIPAIRRIDLATGVITTYAR
jgi:DNA-binding beta-propeller fold protein YncE